MSEDEPIHEPSAKFNCHDGYRVKVVKRNLEGQPATMLQLALYGNGQELFATPVTHQPDTVEGLARCNRLYNICNGLVSYFNCCGSFEELSELLNAMRDTVQQALIDPPEDWQFMQCMVAAEPGDHQYMFLNESTGRVLIVVPDCYTEEVPLEDVDNGTEEGESG